MDGESFDKLSVVVHRLRDTSTRRGALGFVIGAAAAAVDALGAGDVDAKRRGKSKKGCKGFGGKCRSGRDCCSGNCFGNRCFGSGGGGNNSCGGRDCASNQDCCRFNGVSVCVPENYPVCCGNSSFIPGYRCCGGSNAGACPTGQDCCGTFNQCCARGFKCCNNRFCIGDFQDCDDFLNVSSENVRADAAVSEPETVPAEDWIEISPS